MQSKYIFLGTLSLALLACNPDPKVNPDAGHTSDVPDTSTQDTSDTNTSEVSTADTDAAKNVEDTKDVDVTADVVVDASETELPDTQVPADVLPITPRESRAKHVNGYYVGWGVPNVPSLSIQDIKWDGLTHATYFCIQPAASQFDIYQIESSGAGTAFVNEAHKHGVQALISLAYVTNSASYDISSKAARTDLINRLISFKTRVGFDGYQIDWEKEYGSLAALISELRAAVGPDVTIFSAVGSRDLAVTHARYRDHVNGYELMTYDLSFNYGGDDWPTWHNSALYSVTHPLNPNQKLFSIDDSVTAYLNAGIPASKIMPGLPFTGTYWHGGKQRTKDEGINGPMQMWQGMNGPTSETDTYMDTIYSLIMLPGMTRAYDDVSKASYYWRHVAGDTSQDGWVSYDLPSDTTTKCKYIMDKGLGGAFIWHLNGGLISDGSQPNMDAIISDCAK